MGSIKHFILIRKLTIKENNILANSFEPSQPSNFLVHASTQFDLIHS